MSRSGFIKWAAREGLSASLRFYKAFISPLYAPTCRFSPSCSSYMLQAIQRHGALAGLYLGLRRLLRCHPFSRTCRHDPVPDDFTWFASKTRVNSRID